MTHSKLNIANVIAGNRDFRRRRSISIAQLRRAIHVFYLQNACIPPAGALVISRLYVVAYPYTIPNRIVLLNGDINVRSGRFIKRSTRTLVTLFPYWWYFNGSAVCPSQCLRHAQPIM
jgi:hypothetical protein